MKKSLLLKLKKPVSALILGSLSMLAFCFTIISIGAIIGIIVVVAYKVVEWLLPLVNSVSI